jgi:tetratricopeptide (TPR) repeat protein
LYEAQLNLGISLNENQQWTEAQAAFENALALKPSASAEAGLGQALVGQGLRKDAEPHFRKAASLDASYRGLVLRLGSLFEENHQSAEAIAIYREFPDDPGALEHLGTLLSDTGHADEAIPVLEKVVTQSPSVANRVALAQAYLDNKQPDKAGLLMTQVIANQPRDYRLRMLYGRMLRDQRKFTEAGPQFLAAAQIQPDAVEAWSELAAVLILTEQYPQAVAALDRVRALGAETSGHYYFRAMALDHLRQLKEALANYSKFLETSQGKNPDQEFIARQRVRINQNELSKR